MSYKCPHALVGQETGTFAQVLDLALNTVDRHVVLEFAVGLSGHHRSTMWGCLAKWGDRRDRFGVVDRSLANLVVAAKLANGGSLELGYDVRARLWSLITEQTEPTTVEKAVTTYAILDPADLVARATEAATGLGEFIIQCIVSSVPWSVARRYGLHELLEGPWQDFRPLANPRGVSRADVEAALRVLREPDSSLSALADAAHQIASFHVPEAAPELIALARRGWPDGAEHYHRQVFYGLGGLGGRAAVDALVDELLAARLEPTIQSGIVDALRLSSLGAIDPDGRDRVLRHVASSSPQDPRLVDWLGVLEGLPIREGGAIILQIIRCPEALPEVRKVAAGLLVGCSDQAVLRQAIQGYGNEPDHEVRLELLRAARGHDLGIDLDAVRSLVLDEEAVPEEREVALEVILSLDHCQSTPIAGELLATLLPASLADPAFPLGETVLGAADQLPARCLPAVTAHIRQFAEAPLAGFWNTNPKAAITLARRDTRATDLLLRALDAALSAASQTDSPDVLDGLSFWATSLAIALARTAPPSAIP